MSEIPAYLRNGYITPEELFSIIPKPSEERLRKRPVAIPECPQEIPCAPCREICPTGAISMPTPNDLPTVDYEKCIGCSLCVQICPGLAFFMVHYVEDKARITMPHELLPVPKKGKRSFSSTALEGRLEGERFSPSYRGRRAKETRQ